MKLLNYFLAFGLTATFLVSSASLVGQENDKIEIINQDGEKVDANALKVQVQANADDGKITIINADGTKREIDVKGAQSIIVNQAVESIMENGQQQQKVRGKAIIVGPDGQRQEIELGDGDEFEGLNDALGKIRVLGDRFPMPRNWRGQRQAFNFVPRSKYMVGIYCEPVSNALAAQLDLPENTGLLVTREPNPDSPAEQAGIQKHDILMYANQKDLEKVADLTEAVAKAGKENKAIEFSILRRGKESSVRVTPVERPEGGAVQFLPAQELGDLDGMIQLDFGDVGPGIILDNQAFPADFEDRFQKQIAEMEAMMKRQMERMNDMQKRFNEMKDQDIDKDN